MKYPILLVALAAACTSVYAEEHNDTHNFVQLNYVQERPDGEDVKPDGIGILARYDITQHFFLRGEVEFLQDEDIDVTGQSLALGYVINPHSPVTAHFAILVEHEDEKEGNESEHVLETGLETGFHAELDHRFVFHGEASIVWDDGEHTSGVALGLLTKLSEHAGINLEFSHDEDSNEAIEIGLRYSF